MSIIGATIHGAVNVTVPVIKKVGAVTAPVAKAVGSTAVSAIKPVLAPLAPIVPAKVKKVAAAMGAIKFKDFADSTLKFMSDQKHYLSTHDRLASYSDKDTANLFLNNSPEGLNNSIAAHADYARLTGNRELQGMAAQLDRESGMTGAWGRTAQRSTNMPIRKAIEKDAYLWMAEAYRKEGIGEVMPPHINPQVNRVVEAYQKSGFAENSWKRMEQSGLDMSGIRKSSNYVPVTHDGYKLAAKEAEGPMAKKALALAYGEQIAAHYPKLADPAVGNLTLKQIGNAFLKTQHDKITQAGSNPFHGATLDEVSAILQSAGASRQVMDHVLRDIKPSVEAAGKPKNLKPRIGWDFTKTYTDGNGKSFTLGDFVSHNMENDLHSYNMTTGSRVGLAHGGFTDTEMLTSRMNAINDKHLLDPIKHAKVKEFTDNLTKDLLGYAVGERPSSLQRAASQVAAMISLKNSGLYNIAEFTHSIETFGYKAVLKHVVPAFKNMFKDGVNMTPDQAEKITAIVGGNLRAEGRFRSVVGRMESDYMHDVTGPYDMISTLAQSTHYLNMSEWIRRVHIDVITGAQADILETFAKGDALSAKYLDDIGMDVVDKAQLIKDINAHGLYTQLWDQRIAEKLGVSLTRDVDRMAMMVRKGETPAFLAHSAVGKMLMPYFTFTAGANQKILRRAANKDGAVGVAQMMAHQAPLAVLAAMAANVLHGDDYDKDLATKALSIAPGIGYGSLPLSMMTRGTMGGAATPFTAINSAATIAKKTAAGDVGGVIEQLPGVGIILPVRILTATFE